MKKWHINKLEDFPELQDKLGPHDIPIFFKIRNEVIELSAANPNQDCYAVWGDIMITESYASVLPFSETVQKNKYPESCVIGHIDEFAPVFSKLELPLTNIPTLGTYLPPPSSNPVTSRYALP